MRWGGQGAKCCHGTISGARGGKGLVWYIFSYSKGHGPWPPWSPPGSAIALIFHLGKTASCGLHMFMGLQWGKKRVVMEGRRKCAQGTFVIYRRAKIEFKGLISLNKFFLPQPQLQLCIILVFFIFAS